MGEIVNYMQLDTARLEQVVHSIHTVWDGALQVITTTPHVFIKNHFFTEIINFTCRFPTLDIWVHFPISAVSRA